MTLKLNMLIISLHKPIQQALIFNNFFPILMSLKSQMQT